MCTLQIQIPFWAKNGKIFWQLAPFASMNFVAMKFCIVMSEGWIFFLSSFQDVTLHELLDEDDVLQECKAQNRRLIDLWVSYSHYLTYFTAWDKSIQLSVALEILK